MEHDMEQLSESVYANHMYALTCMNEATTNQKLTEPQITKFVANAEQALKRATNGYPQYFNAQFDLARIYIMQQRFAEAKVYLTNALQLDSTNLFVLEELAKTCFDLNLPDETERYANAYLKQFPQNENLHEILAYTLFKRGNYIQAKQYAERGLSYFPASKNLSLLLVDINKNSTAN
jgi:tetratricopeptide (TPR) repeat protein